MATNSRGPVGKTVPGSSSKKKAKFVWKAPDPSWHPMVKGMYNSLKKMTHFEDLEESDMWFARLIAEEHNKVLMNTVEINAAHTKLVFQEWKELGVTLGTRRRLAIEAQKVEEISKTGEQMALLAQQIITGKRNPND